MSTIRFRSRALSLGALTLIATVASADQPLRLVGSTTGSFAIASGRPSATSRLSFTGASFDVTTTYDAAHHDWSYSLGSLNLRKSGLGLITLTGAGVFQGTFTLNVNFSAPSSVSATGPSAIGGHPFSASFTGTMTSNGHGITLDFGQVRKTFAFSGPGGPGTFSMGIENLTISRQTLGVAGKSHPASSRYALFGGGVGQISTVPAPGALAAYGLGFVGRTIRRRRR